MNCVVINFSLTGNTEKIACAIQSGIKQTSCNCDIFPVKEANPRRLYGYDLIGFGHPIMGRKPTINVVNFIKRIRFAGGKHVFLFCTSHSLVNHFSEIVPRFKERGLITIGWNSWLGSVYGPLGDPTPSASDGHPDKIDLEEAEAFGREMVWRSQRIYDGDTALIPQDPLPMPPPPGEPPELAGSDKDGEAAFKKRVHFNLKYNKEKCLYPKCRLCMDNCPVDGIDLSMNPVVIGKPCMTCMMCDQLCPTGAIQCGTEQMEWQFEIEGHGENYLIHHEERKKKPGLRQYVPEEKVIGGFKKQIYKVYNRHPRFVIGKGRLYGFDPFTLKKSDDDGNGFS